MVHFQIKGRERRSIPWLIDSQRDIGRGGGGRRKVRSKEVRILKVESLVLKKKRECERDEREWNTYERL
jgi:hypothetical protein